MPSEEEQMNNAINSMPLPPPVKAKVLEIRDIQQSAMIAGQTQYEMMLKQCIAEIVRLRNELASLQKSKKPKKSVATTTTKPEPTKKPKKTPSTKKQPTTEKSI